MLKCCSKCGEQKSRGEFSRAAKLPDGLQKHCKACNAEYRAANKQRIAEWGVNYREQNRDQILDKLRRYYADNREKHLADKRVYYEQNRDRIKEYRERTKDSRREYARRWLIENKDHVAARSKAYLLLNRDKRNSYKVEWRRANPGKTNAYTSLRRARLLQATPVWADAKAVEQYYVVARFLSVELGVSFQVDHVVPLQSEIVCGLHVQSNLSIMLGAWNQGKSNRFWPDMPANVS